MDTIIYTHEKITKISQVTAEVTLFLRKYQFSNYYIIKIFDLVGEAAIALTEDNPYWLLEDFPRLGFAKVDKMAEAMGVSRDSEYRISSAVNFAMRGYTSKGHTYALMSALCEEVAGYLDLGRDAVRDVIEDMAIMGNIQMTTLAGNQVVYFFGYYRAECMVAGKLAALAEPPKGLVPVGANTEALITKTETMSGIKLSPRQRETVKGALKNGVSIITGGPGTGKTTIINTIISIMEGNGLKVLVAAPTGRAAKRITETCGRHASTVHRLLEYFYDEGTSSMSFGKNFAEPLDCQAVIIDEASMMDIILTGALCDAIKPGTRLIFVGDADQLPSVGAGNVLKDLIDSELFYTARLTEIFRQAEESMIVVNAHRINGGEYPEYGGDFQLVKADKQTEILDKIVETVKEWPFEQVQVLTPVKKGIVGSENLNVKLQEIFNPPLAGKKEIKFGNRIFREGDRIMQIRNNYKQEFKRKNGTTGKGIFNGEIGTIKAVDVEMASVGVEYDDDRWAEYPYIQLEEIEPAYAITVHKSQGSEFPVVIMPMTWFPPLLATRNLIYTAITRGKKMVTIVGNPNYLNVMVDNKNDNERNSGLKERLTGLYQPI